MTQPRRSGILLHPSSLPGPFAIGTLGESCRIFIDFLAAAGQSVWQILPLGPTGYGDSPYSSFSAFAGNPLLICPKLLMEVGELTAADISPYQGKFPSTDYAQAANSHQLLSQGHCQFLKKASTSRQLAFAAFCQAEAYWLNDYAIFRALRSEFGDKPWYDWPENLRLRHHQALEHWGHRLSEPILLEKYIQFVFYQQWSDIKNYANMRGIQIIGDLPIFVAHDSSDVWANQQLFQLDTDGSPRVVAGVPPDCFSETGQRWGNPLYDWPAMQADQFSWWKKRFAHCLQLTDMARVDHFRGFSACWEIPAKETTAIRGRWQTTPGEQLFVALNKSLGRLPLIAEDLGIITPEVEQLRDNCGLPGMKILQFAFDSGPDNPYLPHNIGANSVTFTGTHDNNTTLGWWRSLATAQKNQVRDYLGHNCRQMPWDLIRVALQTRSELCILPMQDILALPGSARMNRPGQAIGNWNWRMAHESLTPQLAKRLWNLCHDSGRLQTPAAHSS